MTLVSKTCDKCYETKPIEGFELIKSSGGRRNTCIECRRRYLNARYKKKSDENLLLYGVRCGKPYKRWFTMVFPEDLDTTFRVCKKCGIEKPVREFKSTGNNQYTFSCRKCLCKLNNSLRRKRFDKNRKIHGNIYTLEERKKSNVAHRKKRERDRIEAIQFYGGKCECCGESNMDMLTFDHINGVGEKEDKKSSLRYYRNKIEAGYPNDKFRLLCWNCNAAIGIFGYCPHHASKSEIDDNYNRLSLSAKYRRKLKRQMIHAYGGKCVKCGEDHEEFMTIDHINGNGIKHKKEIGTSINQWLKRKGWPKDEFQLLCFNCNCSKLFSLKQYIYE